MKPSRLAVPALLACCSWLAAAPAQAQDLAAADARIFKTVDVNGDGKISRREQLHFSDLAFLSMDHDSDDILTPFEIAAWDLGYLQVARQAGKADAYEQGKREAFQACDLTEDGKLLAEEFSVCLLYDFYKADRDKDGALSKAEFLEDYRVVQALRSLAQ